MTKPLDDIWGQGATSEIEAAAESIDAIGKSLDHAEDMGRLARFFAWAEREAAYDAVLQARAGRAGPAALAVSPPATAPE